MFCLLPLCKLKGKIHTIPLANLHKSWAKILDTVRGRSEDEYRLWCHSYPSVYLIYNHDNAIFDDIR